MAGKVGLATQAVVMFGVMVSSVVVGGVILRGLGWGVNKAVDALEEAGVLEPGSISAVQNVQPVIKNGNGTVSKVASGGDPRVTLVP